MLFIFSPFLFLLLMLHISFNYLFIYSYCADKISSRPKMIAPVWTLFQLWVTLEQLDRKLPLYYTHEVGNRNFGRNRNHNMYMINLNIHLFNLTLLPFTKLPNILFYQGFHLTSQDLKSILGHPHNMIVTFIDYMRQLFIFAHAPKIRHSQQNMTTVKDGGFLS